MLNQLQMYSSFTSHLWGWSQSQRMFLHPATHKHPQHPHKNAHERSSTQEGWEYLALLEICKETAHHLPSLQEDEENEIILVFFIIFNIISLIINVCFHVDQHGPGCHGSFVLVLWYYAMSVTEVFPGEQRRMEQGAERVSFTAKSIGGRKRRRNCPVSQNQAMTTGACVVLDVLVRSPWTHYWTWSWPWCPLNFLTHLSA